MRLNRIFKILNVFAGTALLATALGAAAQTYPERPITVVVPFPPGGTTDILARAVAEGIGRELKQSVIVENRAGAGGNVGTEFVARSRPDGYTLLVTTAGPLSINPHIYQRLGFDPLKDLAPISMLASVPIMLVSNPAQPYKTLDEFIAHAKANPGKLSYGSQGNGTTSHLTMELLKNQTGIDLVHIPYRGSAPAANDLMGGMVQIMFDNSPSTLPFVEAGRMRALGVANAERVSAMQSIPSVAETVKGFESVAWFAVVAAAGTPQDIVGRLNSATNATLKRPDVVQRFAASGVTLTGGEPDTLARFIRAESDKWGKVARDTGVKLD